MALRWSLMLVWVPWAAASVSCPSLADCLHCTQSNCGWDVSTFKCVESKGSTTNLVVYDDMCPVVDAQSSASDKPYLSSWMGRLLSLPESKALTLLDVSLPGTHDSLSYDLSLRVSDGGIDGYQKVASALHAATGAIPDSLEDYMRQQGATQGLTVLQQLDSGVRFLDLRVMFEYTDKKAESGSSKWYSLHMMESNAEVLEYLADIRKWLDINDREIVVLWISKHGAECAVGDDQYPNTPVAEKQRFWAHIQDTFAGLLFNTRESSISATPLAALLERKQRVIIMAADWAEFTGSSPFALNSCSGLTNLLGPGVSNETSARAWETQMLSSFAPSTALRQQAKQDNRFLLMSLSTSVPGAQMTYAALIKYLPVGDLEMGRKCAAAFHVPGMTHCPETLLDIAALENYYKQLSLEDVVKHAVLSPQDPTPTSWGFPNAIYINCVDFDGTVRTGTQVLWGQRRSQDAAHAVSAYAYSDSIVLYNIHLACAGSESVPCRDMLQALTARRAKHPLLLWDDADFGRKTQWPQVIAA